MKVQDVMTASPRFLNANASIEEAALLMREHHIGIAPIGENDRLIGVTTDRDLVIRALSEGKGPDTPVQDCMTGLVLYCYQDEPIQDVATNMREQQVQRLVVLDAPDSKSLVGMISLSDIADAGDRDGEIKPAVSACAKQYQRVA